MEGLVSRHAALYVQLEGGGIHPPACAGLQQDRQTTAAAVAGGAQRLGVVGVILKGIRGTGQGTGRGRCGRWGWGGGCISLSQVGKGG